MSPAPRRAPRAGIDPDPSKSWLRRAWPLLRSHRALLVTSLVLSFVGLVVQVQIPNLVRIGIDRALVAHTAGLSRYVALITALSLIQGVINYLARLYLLRTAYELEYDLRSTVFSHFMRMSYGFYDRVQSGELISRATADIRAVQMYLTFGPSILVQCMIAVIAFGLMISVNPLLAVVSMLTMPAIAVLGVRMRKAIFPVSWLIQARLAGVATVVDENIQGVRIVKAFAAEQQQVDTLASAADRVRWAYATDARLRSRWTPVMDNLPRLGLALVLLIGGLMVLNGHATVGTVVAFNSYILMLQPPFRMLGMIIMMGQRAAASARRIYDILDTEAEITERTEAAAPPPRGAVSFDDVRFAYPDGTPGLKGLTLHLEPGETVALVGATGSGKSTIARLAARFYDVTEGTVEIDGVDVRDYPLATLRDRVGIVPDEPFLFSISLHDNIAFGHPHATREQVIAAATAAGAAEFIQELPQGYDTVVGERGYTLSGGQRQRVAIARALLVNPPILILDDATSAVDVRVEHEIHESLRALMAGRTTIMVAHRLATIGLADRVILIDDGRVLADGTHAELLASEPRYSAVLAQKEPVA
ncbi:ABC transporter ATP-binding protein [Actinoplanes sp. SE50]|uniref:ABC transporter ATP-binding protein n=1 Tax=unclassified Actinoplanes TaxID=2626549 RepID=UPI00023EC6A6|nr:MULTISPECIES: ABC transporter ATP-binding protein [unclassified Actinoplanes]AEV86447.1 Lipid A export ATP-binding/permease protein msbA [Actinoplanes sp. SE50/110]ATO84845.1 ABC transporter ATP-binding protein [Actinoplanes sp. SE50]SLM02254.1 ABC transporter ATP-binding protein [Actinoplanes sp. SE50/110]